jgi:spermidine synthase
VIGGATYSFVVMLAAFLTGIALGSALLRARLDAIARPRRLFGWLELGIAATALGTLPLLEAISSVERGPSWFLALGTSGVREQGLRFGLAFGVMLVPATLIGMTFPVAGRIAARGLPRLSREIGGIYAVNTAGNVAGAILAGFVLLPWLGIHRSIALLAFANLAGAAWGLGLGAIRLRSGGPLLGVSALAALLLLSEPARFASEGQEPGSEILFYQEGVSATVAVLHTRGRRDDRVMSVDGVVIGATLGNIHQKQQELAHLPFLLAPGLERGLTIGLGSGIVLGEMVRHPELRSALCVEISPEVVAGAAHFAEHQGDVLRNPRAQVLVDDGINHLRRTRERYDVIVADAKSQPRHGGNAAFLSRDFYASALSHLAPGGLFVQWVPLHLAPAQYRVVLRTFLEAFPVAWVWLSPPAASFLIGAREPLRLDLARMDERLRDPAFRGLRRLGWQDGAGVVGFFVGDRVSLGPLLGAGPVNTLARPLLEFYGLRDYEETSAAREAENRALLLRARAALEAPVRDDPSGALAAAWRAAAAFLEVDWYGGGAASRARLDEALREAPGSPTLRQLAARALQSRALALLAELESPPPGLPGARRAEEAEELLREARGLAPGDFELRLALGEAAAVQVGQGALRALADLVRGRAGLAELPLLVARDLPAKGRHAEAAAFLRQALAADPESAEAKAALGFLLVASPAREELGDPAAGQRLLEEAYRAEPENPSVLNNYAIGVLLAGDPARARALIDRAVTLAPEHPGLRRTREQIRASSPAP